MGDNTYNPYEHAQAQFDRVAEIIGLEGATRELLRQPLREYHFLIPVNMDNGSTPVISGLRVHIKMPGGTAKGGIRFSNPHKLLRQSAHYIYVEPRTGRNGPT